MDGKILTICAAFHDDAFCSFYIASTEIREALYGFSKARDWHWKSFTANFRLDMIGYSIYDKRIWFWTRK